jgi:hypothetical protein
MHCQVGHTVLARIYIQSSGGDRLLRPLDSGARLSDLGLRPRLRVELFRVQFGGELGEPGVVLGEGVTLEAG